MPKELTHWWLAREAVRRIPLDSSVRRTLEEHQSAYLAGAVLPDTLMHILRGPYSKVALKLCEKFHNPPENSYIPLLKYAEIATGMERSHSDSQPALLEPDILAGLLGIAAHMEADIVFHPFVYALAGEDLGRHYRIETELDLWIIHHKQAPPTVLFEELLTEEVTTAAIDLISGIFDPEDELPPEIISEAIHNHARCQAMYSDPRWQLLARLLWLLPGTPVRRWRWLFYPSDMGKGRDITWPSQWKHPVTGQNRGDTPDGLVSDAVTKIVLLLKTVEESGVIAALRKQPGENLLTGLPSTSYQK